MKHDLVHVLSGYDTDPRGESQVVGFIAGFVADDPFWYVFMAGVHVHLGIEVFYGDPTARFAFEPDNFLPVLERGMQVNRDLYDPTIDWWARYSLRLEQVRAELGVPPP